MPVPDIFERDDGASEIGVDGAGPFPSRMFAAAVAADGHAAIRQLAS
jgi:hypothetical protein